MERSSVTVILILDDGYGTTKNIQVRIVMGKTLFMDKKNVDGKIELRAKEVNYKEHSLDCSAVCSRDLDIDK